MQPVQWKILLLDWTLYPHGVEGPEQVRNVGENLPRWVSHSLKLLKVSIRKIQTEEYSVYRLVTAFLPLVTDKSKR